MSHSGKSLTLRSLVGFVGWTLYSDPLGLSSLMHKGYMWIGDAMWDGTGTFL